MQVGSDFVTIALFWTSFKSLCSSKRLAIQYEDDILAVNNTDYSIYQVFAVDGLVLYRCTIFKGTVPAGIITSYSQSTNDSDKTDWEANYKSSANLPITLGSFSDPRVIYRLGNHTASAASEILVSVQAYAEPASQAQRSVKSSSTSDTNSGGSGAKGVRIVYLDSNYVQHTEDVLLNGTTAVPTQGTDIRFIESFDVIKGTSAVGSVQLFVNNAGAGGVICGISAATTQAFLCHHYVPAGKRAWVLRWGATVDDDCNLKLIGQERLDGTNLVDKIFDLEKIFGTVSVGADFREFERSDVRGVLLPEKTYCRVTVVPISGSVIRARMVLFEMPI